MNQEREQKDSDVADATSNGRSRGGPLSRALLGMSPLGDSVRAWGATLAAVGVYFALPTAAGPDGWIVFADAFYLVFLLLTWAAMLRSSPSDIRRWAVVQDVPGSRLRRILLVLASSRLFSGWAGLFTIVSVSFVGLVLGLSLVFQAREGYEASGSQTALYVLGVVLAWALLHTSYALYHAHLYYRDERKPGGLRFPGTEDPDPLDFAYFAFAVGTTFAVSDVEVTSRAARRATLVHGILSFFYNTAILALVLNLVLTGG